MPGPALTIDHLLLEMPGGAAADGQRLAGLVAAGLAAADGMPEAGDVPRLRISVSGAATDPAALAERIVAEIRAALARQT